MKHSAPKSPGWIAAACVLAALGARPAAQPGGAYRLVFPTSGSAEAQPVFLRGVAALHNFEYEEANEAFREAQKIDPGFVMAYWGEAMTYNQTLWRNENVAAARETFARLDRAVPVGPSRRETPTEQAYLAATKILFGDGDAATRRRRYAEAMGALHARYPDDPEAASFYALALLGTMSRSLVGYTEAHEGHGEGLAGSETQTRVARILQAVLESHPDHPGALHYLLHAYDDPAHARMALPAARAYAKVAPDSSHALHMPAHIFLQLGMWRDAAQSDRASFAASNDWIKRKGLAATMRNYHALSWLEYELLQLGRYREARETLGELEPVVKSSGQLNLLSDLSSMRARYAIETRRWSLMADERNFGNANELFAIGVSAARSRNTPLAEMARQALATRARDEREGDLRPAIAIMERQVAALIELAAGRGEQAVEILRAASEAELELPAPFGLPEPVKPAPELLGEVLLEIGRPREALEPFERALGRNANRSLSVLGLARVAAALGQTEAARRRYRELLANYAQADPDLPELKEAQAAVEDARTGEGRVRGAAIPVAIAVFVAAAAAVLWRRFATRTTVRVRAAGQSSRAGRRRRARRGRAEAFRHPKKNGRPGGRPFSCADEASAGEPRTGSGS